MPTLEATRIVRYAGKDQQIGDRFEASEKDAKILVAIQKAKFSDTPANTPSDLPAEVMSRATKREPTTEDEVEKEVDPKPAQTYLHRAMVADAPKATPPSELPIMRHPLHSRPTGSPPGRTGKPKGSGPGRSGKGKM